MDLNFLNVILDPLALYALFLFIWILGSFVFCKYTKRMYFPLILLLILLLIAAPVVVNPTLGYLETRVENEACQADASLPIVILGGGIDGRSKDAGDIHYIKSATYARIVEGVRLAELYPTADIYLAGGVYRKVAESRLMASLLKKMGVSQAKLFLDLNSKNTFENAQEVVILINANKGKFSIRLVTSAVHMLRAKRVFEKTGFVVCPQSVDYQALEEMPFFAILPQSAALRKTALILHEMIGLGYYTVTDKI